MSSAVAAPPTLFALLAFNASNQLAVRQLGARRGLAFTGSDLTMATSRLEASAQRIGEILYAAASETGGA